MVRQVDTRNLVTNINVATNHDLERYLSNHHSKMFVITYDEVCKHLDEQGNLWNATGEVMEYVTISKFNRGGRRNSQMVFKKSDGGTYTSTCAFLLEEELLEVLRKSILEV